MLFGEYGIIRGSMALTIPYHKFSGRLSLSGAGSNRPDDRAIESNRHIAGFLEYLKKLGPDCSPVGGMDLAKLDQDVADGIFFDSDIPQGYGVGSSGALVAAMYDRYAMRKTSVQDHTNDAGLQDLKTCFGLMESYFHGTSSGLDPLICYVNRPIWVRDQNRIELVCLPVEKPEENRGVYLLDAGKPGKTGPLVKEFLERCNHEDFLRDFREIYITAVNRCIGHLLTADWHGLDRDLALLSAYQFDHMRDLIPSQVWEHWKRGIDDKLFKLKLCGSGGGGFILCFASDNAGTESYFRKAHTDLFPVPFNN